MSCQQPTHRRGDGPEPAPRTFTRIRSGEHIWGGVSTLMLTSDGMLEREFWTQMSEIGILVQILPFISHVSWASDSASWGLTQFHSISNRDKTRTSPRSPASLTFSDSSCWPNIKRGLLRTSMIFEINLHPPPRCIMIALYGRPQPQGLGEVGPKA